MPGLPRLILAAVLLGALAAPLAVAQQRGSMPGMATQDTKSASPYHPGVGDLMTAFVQPRHIKLGLAGNEQNWAYAAYALNALRGSFDDIARLVPKHGAPPIPGAIAATAQQPMATLDAAL